LVAPLLLFFKQQLTNKLELFLQSSQYLSQLLTGIKCINIEDGLFSHLKKESDFYDQKEKLSICIIGQTGKLIAVQIGEFLENAEIVVKEYPSSAPKFNYVSGISILATGEPTFLISLNKYCEKNNNTIINKISGDL
jgi:chemotaxis protein histidine kinase CheA